MSLSRRVFSRVDAVTLVCFPARLLLDRRFVDTIHLPIPAARFKPQASAGSCEPMRSIQRPRVSPGLKYARASVEPYSRPASSAARHESQDRAPASGVLVML